MVSQTEQNLDSQNNTTLIEARLWVVVSGCRCKYFNVNIIYIFQNTSGVYLSIFSFSSAEFTRGTHRFCHPRFQLTEMAISRKLLLKILISSCSTYWLWVVFTYHLFLLLWYTEWLNYSGRSTSRRLGKFPSTKRVIHWISAVSRSLEGSLSSSIYVHCVVLN